MGKQGNETATHKYYIEKHMEKELSLMLNWALSKTGKKNKKKKSGSCLVLVWLYII